MSYLVLDLAALTVAAGVMIAALLRSRRPRRLLAAIALAALVVLALTALFDNVMIGAGLFSYRTAHLTGVRMGLAPIEDFAYPLAAAFLMPSLWELLGRRP